MYVNVVDLKPSLFSLFFVDAIVSPLQLDKGKTKNMKSVWRPWMSCSATMIGACKNRSEG